MKRENWYASADETAAFNKGAVMEVDDVVKLLRLWDIPSGIAEWTETLFATLQARNEQLEAQLAEARERLDHLIPAIANAWGAGSEQHNLARDIESVIFPATNNRALAPGCEHQTGPIGDAGQ